MRRILVPLLFVFFFIFESMFVELLPEPFYNSDSIYVPRFLMILIIFMTIYEGKKSGILYGLIFGLLFDVVYTEIIGIYLFMFPLLAYMVSGIMRILQTNLIMSIIVSIVTVTLLELGVYEMNFLIKVTNMNFPDFIQLRLMPTLILNLIFAILFAYPFKRLFEKHVEDFKND